MLIPSFTSGWLRKVSLSVNKFAALKVDIHRELQNLERLTLELDTILATTSENKASF